MSRWIDADKLHEAMQWAIEHDMYDKPFDYIAEVLDAPSIDIVRCKECRSGTYYEDAEMYICNAIDQVAFDADHFCSYGERRE